MDGNPNRISDSGRVRSRRSFLRLRAARRGGRRRRGARARPRRRSRGRSPAPAAAGAAASNPRALKPGDTVGLIAPASYTFDLWRLDDAAARVEALGLKPKFGKYVRGRRGFLSGTDDERLEDLHAMFADRASPRSSRCRGDTERRGCSTGIDYELDPEEPQDPARLLGHHGAAPGDRAEGGLVTFHGPNMSARCPRGRCELLKKALFVAEPIGELTNPRGGGPAERRVPAATRVAAASRAGESSEET